MRSTPPRFRGLSQGGDRKSSAGRSSGASTAEARISPTGTAARKAVGKGSCWRSGTPTAYDGIAAGAPAIYWAEFVASIQWPQQFMNMLGSYPHGCELDAISTAAISACDELDGVVDGVVAHVGACLAGFDPFGLVGTEINCPGIDGQIRISAAAAAVANATWHGMSRADGRQTWCGFSPGADLTGNSPSSNGLPGVAATNCTDGACIGASNILGLQWLQLFVAKDPDFSSGNLTHAEFDSLIHASKEQFKSIINTDDPDLSEFRSAGGKMSAFTGW